MPMFQVVWEEKMTAMVKAKTAEEARELVLNGEITAENAELSSDVEAYKMEDK